MPLSASNATAVGDFPGAIAWPYSVMARNRKMVSRCVFTFALLFEDGNHGSTSKMDFGAT